MGSVVMLPYSSRVRDSILISDYCLCDIVLHVVSVILWVTWVFQFPLTSKLTTGSRWISCTKLPQV